jgi:glycosyltransferase involved in cell wall biosynthesis
MVRLIQHACCVILLSADEGFGLPVAQAMAAGTPVLISAADALREIVGEAGAQSACENIDSVVREWTRVALDAGFRARLVREAAARAETFRRERIANQFVSAIDELVCGPAVS